MSPNPTIPDPGPAKKVWYVRYRRPRDEQGFNTFYCDILTEIGAYLRCENIRRRKVVKDPATNTAIAFGERLANANFSHVVAQYILQVDQPEWWDRTKEHALQELQSKNQNACPQAFTQSTAFSDSLAERLDDTDIFTPSPHDNPTSLV